MIISSYKELNGHESEIACSSYDIIKKKVLLFDVNGEFAFIYTEDLSELIVISIFSKNHKALKRLQCRNLHTDAALKLPIDTLNYIRIILNNDELTKDTIEMIVKKLKNYSLCLEE
jgi:hypothetical protein